MNPHLLAYALRHAPRYTSYPSAPHFTSSIDAPVLKRWLEDLPADTKLSLYLHVPYCRTLCWYCGCNTYAARRDEPLEDFVETLGREIALVASASPAHEVAAIHWGGGTPNMLSPERFARILNHLGFRFDLKAIEEHAIEIDPRHLTAELAQAYARAGVTRASLGVQDLNEHVQRAIGRVQPFEIVRRAVDLLRETGVAQISLDLMYGLPHQNVRDVRASAQQAAALSPQRIAMFGYAHVPWFKARQRLIDADALPGAALRFDQAAAAREALVAAGYVPVGLDHFARLDDTLANAAQRGALKRNFQGYVVDPRAAIIGLGPSGISTLPQGYAQNAGEIRTWRNAIAAGRFACTRGHALCEDDRLRGRLIERIMCDFAVDLADYGGWNAFAREQEGLRRLADDGLVAIDGGRLAVPVHARPFCRIVAQAFDAYACARHSAAV
jgi:oxygen-independent coproporphyrinogen-3 oxidase